MNCKSYGLAREIPNPFSVLDSDGVKDQVKSRDQTMEKDTSAPFVFRLLRSINPRFRVERLKPLPKTLSAVALPQLEGRTKAKREITQPVRQHRCHFRQD